LRSVLCPIQHNPHVLNVQNERHPLNYFFPIGCAGVCRQPLVLQHLWMPHPAPRAGSYADHTRLRSVLCPIQHNPHVLNVQNERHPLNYFFPIGCAAPKATQQPVKA